MVEGLMNFVNGANDILWGPAAVVVLAAVGIYLTIGTKGVHLRRFGTIMKNTMGDALSNEEEDDEAEGVLTSMQSMLTSLASVIGMGSIVGVASAIITGGPGSVFWMWIAALIGMIIKYSEIILIIAYREKDDEDEFVGGPALYIEKGL